MGANNSEKGKARLKDEPTRTAELIARCISADEAAWSLFVKQWRPIIVRATEHALRRFDVEEQKETVEDLTQDVFFHLIANGYRCLRSFDASRGGFGTYLTTITPNIVIDYLRERCPSTVALDESVCAVAVYESAMRALDIPERLLSPRQAQVLRLLYDEGLSAKGVAETLGSTVQAVYEVKQKAMRKLRKFLAQNHPHHSQRSSRKPRHPAHHRRHRANKASASMKSTRMPRTRIKTRFRDPCADTEIAALSTFGGSLAMTEEDKVLAPQVLRTRSDNSSLRGNAVTKQSRFSCTGGFETGSTGGLRTGERRK